MTARRPYLLISLALLALVVTSLSGCTAMQRNAARQKYLNDQMEVFVYEKPIEEVWPLAREVLFERGYQTRDADGAFNVETEWMTESTTRHRYLVSGIKKTESTCSVHFTRDAESNTNTASTGRDYTLEWLVVERAEPGRAAQLEDAADTYARETVPD